MRFVYLVFSMLLISCATPMPDPVYPDHPDPKLMATMRFQVDGVWYSGVALLPRKVSGTIINAEVPKETRFLFFNSCRREVIFENPSQGQFRYEFVPYTNMEKIGSCALLITAITRSGEYHRSIIDFTNSNGRDLPAQVSCNDKQWIKYENASICQNRVGLGGTVQFDTDVIFSHRPQCPPLVCREGCRKVNEVQLGREFDFVNGEGLCSYDFKDQNKREFRLTTVGYTSILNLFPPKK